MQKNTHERALKIVKTSPGNAPSQTTLKPANVETIGARLEKTGYFGCLEQTTRILSILSL